MGGWSGQAVYVDESSSRPTRSASFPRSCPRIGEFNVRSKYLAYFHCPARIISPSLPLQFRSEETMKM